MEYEEVRFVSKPIVIKLLAKRLVIYRHVPVYNIIIKSVLRPDLRTLNRQILTKPVSGKSTLVLSTLGSILTSHDLKHSEGISHASGYFLTLVGVS